MAGNPIYLTKSEIREQFNTAHYYERMRAGEFDEVIRKMTTPSRKKRKPEGTESRESAYFDKWGQPVAIVHYFKYPSGKESPHDPKWLYEDGTIYILI